MTVSKHAWDSPADLSAVSLYLEGRRHLVSRLIMGIIGVAIV